MPFKEATFWWGTIIGGTGIYFWVQGGDRMTAGIILTIVGLLMSAYAVISHYKPQLPKLPMWVAGMVLTLAVLGYDIYDRHHPDYDLNLIQMHWQSTQQEMVFHRTFMNETVDIDGKNFDHCHFTNVTLRYHATAPTSFSSGTRWDGVPNLLLDSDAAKGTSVLLRYIQGIATSQGGHLELFERGKNGEIVPAEPLVLENKPQ